MTSLRPPRTEKPAPSLYTDAHAHLSDPRLSSPEALKAWLRPAWDLGIRRWVLGGVEPEEWARQLALPDDLAPDYPSDCVRLAFGLHPWFVARSRADVCEAAFQELKSHYTSPSQASNLLCALGELGLDYGKRTPPESHTHQREWFERQLQFAASLKKPLILHVVRAHADAVRSLKKLAPPHPIHSIHPTHGWRGIVHSFSGTPEEAQAYAELGLTVSIGLRVLDPKAKALHETLRSLELGQFVLETDAPDAEFSGPEALIIVAQRVGEIRGQDPLDVFRAHEQALGRIFELSPLA